MRSARPLRGVSLQRETTLQPLPPIYKASTHPTPAAKPDSIAHLQPTQARGSVLLQPEGGRAEGHLSDSLRVGGGALRLVRLRRSSFLQAATLTGSRLGSVGRRLLLRFPPLLLGVLRGFRALLLLLLPPRVQLLAVLQGQQVGLFLLQLLLELLGLPLLLQLSPFVLLSAGGVGEGGSSS